MLLNIMMFLIVWSVVFVNLYLEQKRERIISLLMTFETLGFSIEEMTTAITTIIELSNEYDEVSFFVISKEIEEKVKESNEK